MKALPLNRHISFQATTAKDLQQAVFAKLGAECLIREKQRAINAVAHQFSLGCGQLWFCSYEVPLLLRFAEGDYVRLQFQYRGSGSTSVGNRVTAVSVQQACVTSAAADIEFGERFQQIVWRVSHAALVRKLAALVGMPVKGTLSFQDALPLRTPATRSLQRVLSCMISTVDEDQPAACSLLLIELEQAMIVALLGCAEHSHRGLLDMTSGRPVPWSIRRAEEFIEANSDRALDIEEIATVTGVSIRTLYREFRRVRGYTPTEFLMQRRLAYARQLLKDRNPFRTVKQVAHACGFVDAAHFTKAFGKAYGIVPSAVLRNPE